MSVISVTRTAVKTAGFPFTYQLKAAIRQNTSGKDVASANCRRWIQFITITAMNGRKNNSSMNVGNGSATRPNSRFMGINMK